MSSDRALLRASRLSNQIATSLEALALGLVLSSSLCSQDLRFGRLTPADGLSQYSVNALLQDRQGYLWLGTQDGLNRYDGYSIEVFKADLSDPSALGDNFINGILEDSQGDLWVGTNFGLNRLDRGSGTFERFVNDPANDHSLVNSFARFIYEAPDQVLWIGSAGGYSRFDRATQRFRGFAHDPEDPQSLASNNVMDLLDDGKATSGSLPTEQAWIDVPSIPVIASTSPVVMAFRPIRSTRSWPMASGHYGSAPIRAWCDSTLKLARFDNMSTLTV